MRKVNIIHVGNLKEKYYKEAVAEYEKRMKPFFEIKNIEIKEYAAESVKRESAEILTLLEDKGMAAYYTIALCVEGKKYTSEGFAEIFETEAVRNSKGINFIIGGSEGLSSGVKEKGHLLLSFSDMTFPHQLMRVILAEQLYRAATIQNNIRYHK